MHERVGLPHFIPTKIPPEQTGGTANVIKGDYFKIDTTWKRILANILRQYFAFRSAYCKLEEANDDESHPVGRGWTESITKNWELKRVKSDAGYVATYRLI